MISNRAALYGIAPRRGLACLSPSAGRPAGHFMHCRCERRGDALPSPVVIAVAGASI